MELKIFSPTEDSFIKAIEWNHEELKAQIRDKVAMYKNLVYTDDQIKDAKADRASLNKFIKALEDKRKEIKKQCLEPYEKFDAQMKEVLSIVQEPVELIDKQVKEYEAKQKADKHEEIKKMIASQPRIEGVTDWVGERHIFDDKWLNASVKLSAISKAIDEKFDSIATNMESLSNLSEYSFEAKEMYKNTLDLTQALNEAHRLSEMAKLKAEDEERARKKAFEAERLKAEAESKAPLESDGRMEESIPTVAPVNVNKVPEEKLQAEITKQWVSFQALLSTEDAVALKEFFNARHIQFKAI